jgi:hypothetical protein
MYRRFRGNGHWAGKAGWWTSGCESECWSSSTEKFGVGVYPC